MPSPLPQAGYPQAPPAPAPAGPYPAAAEFMSQSRADLRSQVAEGDAQTHYDLGVAYMEMGLHTDAINALTLAMRDRHRECVCLSMIGTIYLQVGDLDAGLDSLHRALNTQHKTRDQELALGYEIANTYELKGMAQQALHYFDWLARLDPQYQEPRGSLSERIHRLRVGSGPQPRPVAPPSGDTGALDRAMDDIIKSR
jgi:tetratricopeptide (TPR) repeat protein